MTTWIYKFEVVVDDEMKKSMGIDCEEYDFVDAIENFEFVESASFLSGITKEKLQELKAKFDE